MIEEMQWVRPEEIEARSMAIIESEMPKGSWSAGELYIENRIREAFGFRGTPLRFIIRERKEK